MLIYMFATSLSRTDAKELKDVSHSLAQQKECKIEEGYLMPDHVHMLISIPPKHSISTIVGFIKGDR